jgi:hypothetical protein
MKDKIHQSSIGCQRSLFIGHQSSVGGQMMGYGKRLSPVIGHRISHQSSVIGQ